MLTFNRGSWEEGSPLLEWQDDETSDDYRQRVGYTGERTLFGHEYGGHLEIYESSIDSSFYASICPAGGTCYEVFLPDLPSFMMFIRDYGTVFATEATNVSQQQILQLLEKIFRVQHGHAAQAVCQECDPDAWKAREHRLKRQ